MRIFNKLLFTSVIALFTHASLLSQTNKDSLELWWTHAKKGVTSELDKMANHLNKDFQLTTSEKGAWITKIQDFSNQNINDTLKCFAYRTIGILYSKIYKLDSALLFNYKGLETLPNCTLLVCGKLNFQIGSIHARQRNLEGALAYFKDGLEVFKKNNDSLGIAGGFNNLGQVLTELNQLDSAILYLNKAIEMKEKLGDKQSLAKTYNNLGNLYIRIIPNTDSHKKSARENWLRSLDLKQIIGDSIGMVNTHNSLGLTGTDKEYHFNKVLDISKALDYKAGLRMAYNGFREIYLPIGDYKKAYEYTILINKVQNEISNENIKKNISELELQYETKLKENKITLLSKDNEIKDSQITNRNMLIGMFSGGIILLLLLVRSIRLTSKTKIETGKKEKEIQKIKHESEIEILKHNREIQLMNALIDGQETERKRIASDLHDGVGGMLAGVSMNLNKLDKENSGGKEVESIRKLLDDVSLEVRKTAHNLMPVAISKNGIIKAIESFIEKAASTGTELEIHFENYGPLEEMKEESKIHLYRIIQESIHNSIKHGKAKNLWINLIQDDGLVHLSIEDDGVGFNVDSISNGIGINSVKSRSIALGGECNIQSTPGSGTTTEITIPIHES